MNHAVDLNSFFGYAPAINRTTGVRAQFVTDPSCLYDAATQRFFVVVLTLETFPNGAFTHVNHLDIAVSQTSNPTGAWNIYRFDVTNDGTNTGGVNPGPYLGDYPHIGADANGFYITTNAYPWCCNGFCRRTDLRALEDAAGRGRRERDDAAHRHLGHGQCSERRGLDAARLHGLAGTVARNGLVRVVKRRNRVLPQLERGGRSDTSDDGYGWQPHVDPGRGLDADQHVVAEHRDAESQPQQQGARGEPVRRYRRRCVSPAPGRAPGTDVPQGFCINNTTTPTIAGVGCWRLLFTAPEPAHNEVISTPDSNDTRMQQVMYANGKLWGALDSAVTVGGPNRAGIAYYVINPSAGKLVAPGPAGRRWTPISHIRRSVSPPAVVV